MVLMGAVINADTAANFLMLGFWCVMYSVNCYNSAYQQYLGRLYQQYLGRFLTQHASTIYVGF